MPNQLEKTELQDWRLLTIHDLGGKGKSSAINDELKKKLLLLKFPERDIDAKISIGWYWTELKERELIVRGGREWQLTDKGTARVQELEPGKKQDRAQMESARQAGEKRQAVAELARETGMETKVWILQKFPNIAPARLEEILARSISGGANVIDCLPTAYQERMDVEAAAIKHIRKTEPKMKWRTTRTNNPGFDLYRVGKNGVISAWCEVKAISGPFDRSVALTRREFDEAQLRGQDYWLYVVENVGTSNPNIIRIQDPAGQTERFQFGHNWRNMAQDAAS